MKNCLPAHLKSLGYETFAVYTTARSWINVGTAFQKYGIDRMFDVYDLRLERNLASNRPAAIGVPDEIFYRKALSLLEEPRRAPRFIFVSTNWNHGPHGVAEAMDTAQRGMGLDWPTSLELIRRSLDAAKDHPGAIVASGCGTDHLAPEAARGVDDVIRAYSEQMEAIEKLGGRLIVMASRALARVAKGPEDYARVYDHVLSQARQPVILHWLGDMFDPALAGYWGSADAMRAMDTALGVIAAHAAKVDGIKISLLDKDKEIAMRRRLPQGVRMYTGDDFNFAELIAGDEQAERAEHGSLDRRTGVNAWRRKLRHCG